jgi:hypothetical protein
MLFMSEEAGPGILLALPGEASATLPSRGMVMVEGTINGTPFRAVLEPDGKGSHWFKVDGAVLESAGADAGDTVVMEIEPSKEWLEPRVPALGLDTVDRLGQTVGNAQAAGRERLFQAQGGKRRPCCFDRSQCTLTDA